MFIYGSSYGWVEFGIGGVASVVTFYGKFGSRSHEFGYTSVSGICKDNVEELFIRL
jgi:hypothetical protein